MNPFSIASHVTEIVVFGLEDFVSRRLCRAKSCVGRVVSARPCQPCQICQLFHASQSQVAGSSDGSAIPMAQAVCCKLVSVVALSSGSCVSHGSGVVCVVSTSSGSLTVPLRSCRVGDFLCRFMFKYFLFVCYVHSVFVSTKCSADTHMYICISIHVYIYIDIQYIYI